MLFVHSIALTHARFARRSPPPTQTQTRVELETFTQCSSSLLWKLMMSFYDRKGVSSWSQGIVPHFITCNAFIGRAYAKVLAGFIEDLYDAKLTNERLTNSMKLNPEQPLYIIELGTGAGKFSFFMLKALNEMRETVRFPVEKIGAKPSRSEATSWECDM
ncbi:hypothetical protein TL16_g07057 [Triparma laevis f. inornata]|uniref:Uncharacterized protein n=1 Tax=Triparma laevis f. inornata TaxID=1714386 RepID=A0A9W7ARG7_9STRA|nr:hypothetical protein TL16_g07057 [Triparma laevis f. inornata]